MTIVPNFPCRIRDRPMSLGPEDRAAVCVDAAGAQEHHDYSLYPDR